MAPSRSKPSAKQKREKVFHPESRKAGQLARSSLRKGKLSEAASKRGKKHNSQVDVYGFFFHALPESGVLTLKEVHGIVKDVWLTRHDDELEHERVARRKGRPKSTKEVKLEEIKLREAEEYRTGMEVPDLTNLETVELFRRWNQKEVAFIQLLRFIRIFRDQPEVSLVSRPGKHFTLLSKSDSTAMVGVEQLEEQATVQWTPPGEPPQMFSSTIMMMDGQIS